MGHFSFTLFHVGFLKVSIMDILDVLLLSYLLYRLYLLVRGTRAVQMAVGLILILITSFIVKLFNMSGMTWIFDNLKTIWLIAFVIVFQPELRRILIYIGQSPLLRRFFGMRGIRVIDEVVKASLELSKRGFGGLIVLVRDTGIRGTIETGMRLQAEISAPLIVSIFNPLSPLHDGAVIIQNDLIEAAKCILPLSESSKLEPWYGTRHRAALGMSEESDAVVIVVSEETRRISVAMNGELYKNLDEDSLRRKLEEAFRIAT
ncbi:TIGR00159 family protein [candidate division KSB1 bacterium]|nr:diadenylate cyclase CdaA [bacterium]RKY84507.1 MAG: TIGR00159 family protein [candidate division KSB1 bacterium]RKY89262.1 MAG: TIGR00159 family protein [candidate division KSB1 bacterium]HDI52267.1 TIGR00159 family protein [Bacteroidota bacterium]